MTRPNVLEFDVATGEQIVREMNDDEYAVYLADQELQAEAEAAE
jgi:hypothetical protein